jgi:hypothetical protein
MERRDGLVTITDLRLGMEPDFGFTFAVFEDRNGELVPIRPRRMDGARRLDSLPWLWRRLKGEQLPPP